MCVFLIHQPKDMLVSQEQPAILIIHSCNFSGHLEILDPGENVPRMAILSHSCQQLTLTKI